MKEKDPYDLRDDVREGLICVLSIKLRIRGSNRKPR